MSRAHFDPHDQPPRTFRERLSRKVKRTVEPLAIHLLEWCRSLHTRVEAVEGRVDAVGTRVDAVDARFEQTEARFREIDGQIQSVRGLVGFLDGLLKSVQKHTCDVDGRLHALGESVAEREAIAAEGRQEVDWLRDQASVFAAEVQEFKASTHGLLQEFTLRADQGDWGRQALVERLNAGDEREIATARRLAELGHQADETYWAREALIERLDRVCATQDAIRADFEAHREGVADRLSLPLAFGLDSLAMGRRLAALEDQVELLQSLLAKDNPGLGATLVPFPKPDEGEHEKAAG
jgi:chromosome segregation ATPase